MRAPRLLNVDVVGALLLGAVGLVSLSQLGDDIRNWVFPQALTYVLFIVAAILAVSGVRKYLQEHPADIVVTPGTGGVVAFAAGAVLYVVAITWIGFWVASLLALAAGMVFLGSGSDRGWRSVALACLASVCAVVAAYLVFTQLFYLALPGGG